jgi:hypothetical protein
MPCGEDINRGDFILMHPTHGAIHEDCREEADATPQTPRERRSPADPGMTTQPVMPRGLRASDRCDRCFLVHVPGQVECE